MEWPAVLAGLGSDIIPHAADLDHLSISEGNEENVYYASMDDENMVSIPFEPTRRPHFAASVYSASTGSSSSFYTASRSSVHDAAGRAGGRGGGNGSIFSSEGDGMTKASRTSSGSVARPGGHAANLAAMEEEDDGPQMPELLTVEPVAEAQIADAHHWYHAGFAPRATGSMASSATAMASAVSSASTVMGEPFTNRRGGDSPATVAMLPCELQPYTGCPMEFKLYASGHGVDEWADHGAKAHLAMHFPRNASCWFCSKLFLVDPGSGHEAEVYKQRMKHISRHFLRNETLPEIRRPDSGLIRHLCERGILRDGEGYVGGDAPPEQGTDGEAAARRPRVMPDTRPPVTINTVPPKKLRPQDVHVEVAGERRRRRE